MSELSDMQQIFKALNNDIDDEVSKLRLLYNLRDHVELILGDIKSIESLVEFLRTYYFGLVKSKQKISNFFQSQILVVWTTVLLSVENLENDKLQESFVILFDEMIQIILNINNVDNCVLRSVACDCIIEMEMEFPGLLNQMLETLLDLCVRETTYVHQKYTLLLSFVCKNNYLVECDPFDRTHQMLSEILKRQSSVKTLLTSPSPQDSMRQQTISCLLEHIPTTSSHTASTIIRNAAEIICGTDPVPPSVLKSVVLKYKQTYDLSLLHTVCFLQLKFGKDLFSETEEQQLLFHIVNLSNFPLLSSCQRKLYLDWLQYYANSDKLQSDKNYADEIKFDSSFALKFSPSVFDDWEILLKKYHLMTNLFSHNADQNECCRVLFCCFSSSFDVVRWSMNHRSAVTFFRILHIFLKFFPRSFCSDFIQFLNDFVHYHSNFSYVTVKFLECIQRDFPETSEILWRSVVTFITRSSVDATTFQHYCIILNRVSNRPFHICQPKEIITFIKSFLTTSIRSSSSWCLGNKILQICHNLVKYQNSNEFFTELGDLLCILFTKFTNVDVQDSCRLLYVILTSLSSQKINAMFNSVPAAYHSNSVSTLDTETSSYGIASRIAYLNHSPIELIKSDPQFSFDDDIEREIETISNITVLQPYFSFIDSDEYKGDVNVAYSLQFLADYVGDGCLNKLFSIHLKCESSTDVADIIVPHLIRPRTRTVSIKLRPRDFKPIKLHYNATFNTINTDTFTCRVKPVCLNFDDYFLPFPVPFSFYKVQFEFRKRLFDHLWDSFEKSAQQGLSLSNCEKSVHLIKLSDVQIRDCIVRRFARFLMEPASSKNVNQCRVGIFLPPRNHILIKFEIRSTDCLALIMVDHWSLLSPLNFYLLSLEEQKWK